MSQQDSQAVSSASPRCDRPLSTSENSIQIKFETTSQSDRLKHNQNEFLQPSTPTYPQSSEFDQVNNKERQYEQSRILEKRKDSKLLKQLQEFGKQQIILQEYNRMIQEAFQNKVYRRKTFLGKTPSGGEKNFSYDNENETNLTKEEQIDDYEIKAQFIKGPDSEQKQEQLYLDIAEDIDRLCFMYLNGLAALNNTLPSKHVEKRMYEKIVIQVKTWSNAFNEQQDDPNSNQNNQSSIIRTNSASGSLLSQNQHSNSIRTSSLLSNSAYNDRPNSITQDRANSIISSQTSEHDLNRGISMTSSSSLFESNTSLNLGQEKQLDEHKYEKTQCSPKLTRVDQLKEPEAQQLWQQFAEELQTNSTISSEIVGHMMNERRKDNHQYDIRETNLLVNLSHLFLDNIHAEERLAFTETNKFLRFFTNFAASYITPDKFGRNQMNNVFIQDAALQDTLMCLFEGLTRKAPAFTYLRFVYTGTFSKINMSSIDSDLKKFNEMVGNTSSRVSVMKPQNKAAEPQFFPQKEEKKVGPIRSFFRKLFSKDEEKKVEEQKMQAPVQAKVEQLSYRESKREQKMLKQQRSYQSMAFVYGDQVIPFPPIPPLEKDILQDKTIEQSFEIQKTYAEKMYQRSLEIENKINDAQVNKHTFLMDQYPNFNENNQDRIHITENDLKKAKKNTSAASQSAVQLSKKEKIAKNLTYHIKELVKKNFEQVLNFMNKIPFSIRAMMKILILKSRGITDFKSKIIFLDDEIRLLANFIVAGWLSTGYRNPKCFGIQPSEKKELELEYVFFQASRITFEHLMLMQKIPVPKNEEDQDLILDYDIDDLNEFILSMREQIFVFWIRIIQVDIKEIETVPISQVFESNMLRIDDLELLYIFSNKIHEEIENKGTLCGKVIDANIKANWSTFIKIMSQMNNEIEIKSYDQFDTEFEKPLIPKNRFGFTISRHFSYQFGIEESLLEYQYECYLLFLKRKSVKAIIDNTVQWQHSCQLDMQKFNSEFIEKKLSFSFLNLKPRENFQDQDQSSTMLQRIHSMKEKRDEKILHQRAISGLSQQLVIENTFISDKQQQRLIKTHKLNQEKNPVSLIEEILMNIYNSLRVLLSDSQFVMECLKDQSNQFEVKDLVQLFLSAQMANRISSQPSLQIQAGCKHIVRLLQKLDLYNNLELQNKILSHFLKIIDRQIMNSRRYLDQMIINMDTLAFDLERFEFNVVNLKAFNAKFEITQLFIQTIQGFNPEVCLFDLTSMSAGGTLKDFIRYKGVILNLCCVNHRTNLGISTIFLFGQVNKKEIEAFKEMLKPKLSIISANELTQRQIKQARLNRLNRHFRDQRAFTKDLQNPEKQYFPGAKSDDFDKEIKRIEDFIDYYTKKYVKYLKSVVKTDDRKYKDILEMGLYAIPAQFTTEKEKIDYLRSLEPLDYMNIVKTYFMFLHAVSLNSSRSEVDTLDAEKSNNRDKNYFWKQHHDFICNDLKAKALRYYVHSYIVKRFYQVIFSGPRTTKDYDEYVQKLILQKENDPDWVLCSEETIKKAKNKQKTDDFAGDLEWCDPEIYKQSHKTLLKMQDEDMPHVKANYIEEAVSQAILATKIATPYKKSDAWGEPQRMRTMKYLILQLTKTYHQAKTNVKLYSQLLYILQFNIPKIEVGVTRCIEQQQQKHDKNYKEPLDYTTLDYTAQHLFVNEQNRYRNKAAEWFDILNALIYEDQQKAKNAPPTQEVQRNAVDQIQHKQ